MSKDSHKNTREPMGKVENKSRPSIFRKRQMEDSFYHEKYGAEYKLMWILDEGGQLDRWIDAGAEPVERESRNSKKFEGLTNRHDSPYMRVVGGVDAGGNTVYQYLLMIAHELYDEIKTQPLRQRQKEIRQAMGLDAEAGEDIEVQALDAMQGNKAGLKTYAANNLDGSAGFNQVRST